MCSHWFSHSDCVTGDLHKRFFWVPWSRDILLIYLLFEFCSDGMHLSPIGNQTLLEELLKVLKNANWVPNLYWENMPSDFGEPSPYDYVHPSQELCAPYIKENEAENHYDF